MTYLITGASGFIGSHLAQHLLRNGHSVINVDNFDSFYDYKIKIRNTLESLQQSPHFSFSEKDTDINKLVDRIHSERYQLYYQDIRDRTGLKTVFENHSVDMVIHLAALAGVRPSIDRPLEYEEVNIRGTMNLWELCRDFKIQKFICASSSSVYGITRKSRFLKQIQWINPFLLMQQPRKV